MLYNITITAPHLSLLTMAVAKLNLLSLLYPLHHLRHVNSFVVPEHDRPSALVVPSPFSVAEVAKSTFDEAGSDLLPPPDDDGPHLGAWMPLGSASALTGLTPVQIRVCGVDIAVWHKPLPKDSKRNVAATEWSALVDACPHRLAPLSQGRVDPNSGCIECPYHGWSFDTDGTLKSIPQLDEGRTIKAATGNSGGATSLPVHAAGDLLFVFLPTDVTGESWPITRLPEDHYPYLQEKMKKGATYYSRDLPYSFDFLLENFMDPAHIPIAHHSFQGTRDDGSPIEMQVIANNFTHFEFNYNDICNAKKRDSVNSFERPAFFHFRTRAANTTDDYKANLLIFTSPIEEGRCRVHIPELKIKFAPRWMFHLGANRLFNSDTWLHDAERSVRITNSINQQRGSIAVGAAGAGRNLTNGLNYISASKSDLGPAAFRKWWLTHGYASAPPNTFGPASASSLSRNPLSRVEQIDPWPNHAKNCASCRRALNQMRNIQKVVIAGSSVGAVILQRRPPLAIAIVLAGIFAHNFLRKFATTVEGNTHRAEIDDRSIAQQ